MAGVAAAGEWPALPRARGRPGRRVAGHGRSVVTRPGSGLSEEPVPGVRAVNNAVKTLVKDKDRRWEVRSAGTGSKGERWYAWAWIATASPRHSLLVRRHLKTGELAFHYCFVPEGQQACGPRTVFLVPDSLTIVRST